MVCFTSDGGLANCCTAPHVYYSLSASQTESNRVYSPTTGGAVVTFVGDNFSRFTGHVRFTSNYGSASTVSQNSSVLVWTTQTNVGKNLALTLSVGPTPQDSQAASYAYFIDYARKL